MRIVWHWHAFPELQLHDLYEMLALRQQVFVVEQDCPYLDADGRDAQAQHLLGRDADGALVAYARVLPRGARFADEISVGRVVTAPAVRGRGVGLQLMHESLRRIAAHLGPQAVRISAQSHLQRFYARLGFVATGQEYLEDGIPHRQMLRPARPADVALHA